MPCVLVGGGSELTNPEIIPGESAADYNKRFFARIVETTIRDDLDTPILILLSETEARMFRVPPQPDAAKLRLWEVAGRSEEHTSELQSLMRISYAVFCLKKKTTTTLNRYRKH